MDIHSGAKNAMGTYKTTVIDVYDDPAGSVLRSLVEDAGSIPDFVKSAALLNKDQEGTDRFALVMVEGDSVLKKYATADAGNTWMSALYFLETSKCLTKEAQEVAATYLTRAASEFGMDLPEEITDLADDSIQSNIVDVSGAKLASVVTEREQAVEYAIERLDGSKYYPLRDSADVSLALDYFDRHAGQFTPRERREYSVKVASVAERFEVPVTGLVEHYAAQGWNPRLEDELLLRKQIIKEAGVDYRVQAEIFRAYDELEADSPDEYAEKLASVDQQIGLHDFWSTEVSDPWLATVGMAKTAKGHTDEPETHQVAEVAVTQAELEGLAVRGKQTLLANFGEKFTEAYAKDPVKQFKALPLPQRRLIARLASSISEDVSMG